MSDEAKRPAFVQTRRSFMATTTALAGAAAIGLPRLARGAQRHPKRGGVLRFATRDDTRGLDSHRNFVYYVSHPMAGTTGGLLDFNGRMEPVPAIATEWDVSKDLKTWTFKLRRGAEFHNGESIDAEAVKWNYERIMDPKIGHSFTRGVLGDLERVSVDDKYTVRCHLKNPSAIFAANLIYYPANLMAPGAVDRADTHPVGCGPFKFKSWKRHDTTELERFENFWETDAEGNALPYLDGLIGYPKKEDRVRLTALRTGEVDLIDNMAYADAAEFESNYGKDFNTWEVPHVGTAYISFNQKNGPFSAKDNPDAHLLRMAAAHAIDHEGIHQAIFHERGAIAKGFYSKSSPWYAEDIESWPEYDPDKARAILKKANGGDATFLIVAQDSYPYMHQSAEIAHAMLQEAGFKISLEIHPSPVLREKYQKGDFHLDSSANSYRLDPDAWYARALMSTSPDNKLRYGYESEKIDQMLVAAKVEVDQEKRRQIYRDVDSLVNKDLPLLYTHYVPLLQAGSKRVQGYQPAFAGPFQYAGGGLRTTWLEG